MDEVSHPDGVDPFLGKILDERYRIERQLGEGGIGRVYVAKHATLGREVALKVLLTRYGNIPVLKQRFQREAEALAALSHPNIVTVTDFGVTEGMPYIVMELLEGEDLSELLARGEVLEPRRALEIVRQMLRALAYAHEQALVHRDLKPHNVFVRSLGAGADHVEVLDFGLARFLTDAYKNAPKLTAQGALIGTPAYMAPEQASGEEVDARADVYAAGCVLFEALTGRRVFPSADPGEILRSHMLAPAPTLADADPGLEADPALEALLRRALSKSPAERFANAQEMLDALDALGAEPARRVGPQPASAGSDIAPTQGATRASGPKANAQDTPTVQNTQEAARFPTGISSVVLPEKKMPLFAAAAGAALLLMALGAGGVWYLMKGGAETVEPTPEPPTQEPTPEPTPEPPSRPAARDPFEGVELPEELERMHTEVEADRVSRVSRRELSGVSRYVRDHDEDPLPHLVLAHYYVKRRFLSHAFPQYERAYELDETVRGDPSMLRDLLEMVRSNTLNEEASDFVVQVYGEEAVEATEESLEERMPREERERLEALRARLTSE